MTESIFGDLDVSAAAADPFHVKDGTWRGVLSKAEVSLTKDEKKKGLTLFYTLQNNDDDVDGKTVREWKWIPTAKEAASDAEGGTKEGREGASWLRQRLESLGIPPDELNKVTPDKLVGLNVVLVIKENDRGYPGVNKVELDLANSAPQGNPFQM